MLSVAVEHRLGDFVLDAAFESGGGLTALFGCSGSGKTTLVNAIAGLLRPNRGRIVLDGEVVTDTASGVFLPARRRHVGYVFQEGRLFPHLTVRQNLLYGHWFAPRHGRVSGVEHVVELLGIGGLLGRRPTNLSGGEKQRVAIGRALLAQPRLLVMDEPLASLDEERKTEILPYIERLRDETKVPIVYVSHAIAEVARLATDVVLMSAGKVTASGPTAQILQRLDLLPADEAAEGGALLEMAVERHDETFGMTVLTSAAGEIRVPKIDAKAGTPVRLRIRARDVMVATEAPRGLSALNVLSGRIAGMSTDGGPLVDVRIDCNGEAVLARLTRQSTHTLGLALGQEVFAVVKTVSFERGSATRSVPVDA
jgi:molybdate transport system ATP-binding protein